MRYWLFLGVCCFGTSFIQARESKLFLSLDKNLQGAIDRGEYKDAIRELQKQMTSSTDADLHVVLATLYLRDQQEELALESFVKALKVAKPKMATVSKAELTLFDEFLPIYLNQKEGKEQLEQRLISTLQNHPEYLYVQFLLAATHANKRKFEDFFHLFYRSYIAHPNSYMAYKSQGVLASLLLQRAREVEQKQGWRKEAIHYFTLACKEMPDDVGLYKMLICTAGPEEKKEVVIFTIKTIIDSNIVIPRSEIPFYINEALLIDNVDLAQELLKKATSWYQYSRIIEDMKRSIDER